MTFVPKIKESLSATNTAFSSVSNVRGKDVSTEDWDRSDVQLGWHVYW